MCDEQFLKESSPKKNVRPVRGINRDVPINLPDSHGNRSHKLKTKVLIGALVALVLIFALCAYLIGFAETSKQTFEPSDTKEPRKLSPSRLYTFQKAAVCTDAPECSEIGKNILLSNGSAVDAAVAIMFCNSLFNQQSVGLGGGFFMMVYIKQEEKAHAVIAREKAPASATYDMFEGNFNKSFRGPLAVAVPGELRGMWTAHQRWGKLPWADLVEPTIAICTDGFQMSIPMHEKLALAPWIKNDVNLKKMYVNSTTDTFYKPGTVIKPYPALCKTLSIIAQKGGDELYNGSLSVDFLEDLNRVGSIITADDLRNYQAKVTKPIAVPIGNEDILYTPPPPSSGVILVNILNILSGYHFNATSINDTDNQILTYHRILEAFKYSYALRSKLADEDFLDLKELIANLTSTEYGNKIRLKINDTQTSNDPATYGADEYNKPDHGTAHISIIASNGDAVSVTSSINYYYGAGFSTLNTGIIMNNVMDDFSSPGFTNMAGIRPSLANFIAPGKRPLSSMNPCIIVDRAGNAKLVIGGAGSAKITSTVALVTMRKLWFNQSIKEAVDKPRIHHQILPMEACYEFGISDGVIKGLKAKGHEMSTRYGLTVVCALYRNSTAIYGNADYRKGGNVAGID